MIDEADLAAIAQDKAMLELPKGWRRTADHRSMPDVIAAIRSSRIGR